MTANQTILTKTLKQTRKNRALLSSALFSAKESFALIIASLVTGFVNIFVAFISSQHMCTLQSNLVEIPLFILTLSLSCFWPAKAKTAGLAWFRACSAIVIVIILYVGYQSWLHSDYFPKSLLSAKALENTERMKKKIEDRKKKSEPKK